MSAPRCLILNASYEFLSICDWFEAICLVLDEKAIPLAEYNDLIRSQYLTLNAPAVLLMKYFVKTRKRKSKFTSVSKKAVLIRDNYKCQYCGCSLTNNDGTLDHVIPRAKGGQHTFENVVSSCKPCNNEKDSLSLSEYTRKTGKKLLSVPRSLNDEEKIRCLIKSFKSKERNIWLDTLKKNGITLW